MEKDLDDREKKRKRAKPIDQKDSQGENEEVEKESYCEKDKRKWRLKRSHESGWKKR